MIIECNYCESKVDAKVIGSHEDIEPEYGELSRISLVECPVCHLSLLGSQVCNEYEDSKIEWDDATRIWPKPDNYLHWSIPDEVRNSLEEAQICFKAKAYSACAVMCGRAIEALCIQHTKEKTLYRGLKSLKEKGIIDARIFEWGDSLRHERNLGAHATGVRTTRDDASDVLDFAVAICEYVCVLSEKYKNYQKRKGSKSKAEST